MAKDISGKKKKGKKKSGSRAPHKISALAAGAFGGDGKIPPKDYSAAYMMAPPVNVCEKSKLGRRVRMAMDSALSNGGYYSSMFMQNLGIDGTDGISFVGYPALAMLQQNPLMRLVVDTITEESARKWVTLKSEDEIATDDDIKRIESYLEKWAVRDVFKQASNMVGFQGGCLLFIDTGVVDPKELKTPLVIAKETISRGQFKGFRMVEPMLVYPGVYEAANPLSPNYFSPETWIVLGQEIHVSRFLYFASNDVTTVLRPAYNFFGIPLVQLMSQYVANFESARDSAAEIVNNFALLGLKTNMGQTLTGGDASDLVNRAKIMLAAKRNQGLALIDKATEEFFQIATPLSGLKDLVSQQLELLALISGTPVTKLFGTAPQGMNATGEGDKDNWQDKVRTWQEKVYFTNFKKARQLIELSEYGQITTGIVDFWEPLEEPDPTEAAAIRKVEAETDAIYTGIGAILPEEVRDRLADDEESGYSNLAKVIDPGTTMAPATMLPGGNPAPLTLPPAAPAPALPANTPIKAEVA